MPTSNQCPKIDRCPLFPQFKSEQNLTVLKTLYCESLTQRWKTCQRFTLAASGTMPPATLLPDGRHLSSSRLKVVQEGATTSGSDRVVPSVLTSPDEI